MSNNTIKIALAIVLLGAAGFVVYSTTKAAPKKVLEQPKLVITQLKQADKNTPVPSSAARATAKDPVEKFVTAVANPSKPAPTADDKKNALSYLTPELATKVAASYGNDPGKLLAIPHPTSFLVRDGTGDTKSQEVRVTFRVASGPDLTVYFSVRADNHGRWLINSIQKNVPSPSLPR